MRLLKKNNYTEAIFLLSQIEVGEGNITQAIRSVETASIIAPNDPTVFFQLGLLRYSNDEFSNAVYSLERAIDLNPLYANAKYFLGLSYDQIGETQKAIEQFESILSTNPDNNEVSFILKNLKEGRAPFKDVTPPLDEEPESREELPLEE